MADRPCPWTADQRAALRDLIAARFSAGQIAQRLLMTFQIARTRSAVAGEAHRLHLRLRGRAAPPPPKPVVEKPKPVKQPNPIRPVIRQPAAPPPARRAEIEAHGLSCHELTASSCRWIDGDPFDARPFKCADPKVEGRPYCAAHCKRAWSPRPQPRRAR